MSEHVMELMLSGEPDWKRAVGYVEAYNAIRPEDDDDGLAREAVVDQYVTGNPEAVDLSGHDRIADDVLEAARAVVEGALADSRDDASAMRVGSTTLLRTEPESEAADAVAAAWRAGVLGAAGFSLPE